MDKQTNKDDGRGIVRFLGADLDGNRGVRNALLKVKGISFSIANAMLKNAGIDPNAKMGQLSEADVDKLKGTLEKPTFPKYLFNRRDDPFTGKTSHLTSADLDITHRQDLEFVKRLGSYKGVRHRKGLPVRGQRTRSSFRTSKGALGVIKKKEVRSAAAAPAKAPAKKEEKKK